MDPDKMPVHGPDINVTLTTPRLRIEPLNAGHAAPLFEAMRDPALYEWISMAPSPDLAHLERRWTWVAERPLVGVDVLDFGWAVQRVADGAWIGKMDAEVTALGVANNVGYLFLAAYWGQGYATEAVTALSDHLCRHGVVRQHATVTRGNDASCRVLEHAGFVRERVIVGNDMLRGVLVDDVEYVRRHATPPLEEVV
jgi:ribosomal-protein-alanine N-acetyltransferase